MSGTYRLSFVGPSKTRPGQLLYALYVGNVLKGYKSFTGPQKAVEWVQAKNAEVAAEAAAK